MWVCMGREVFWLTIGILNCNIFRNLVPTESKEESVNASAFFVVKHALLPTYPLSTVHLD